jgi:predicted ester cyclase
MANSVSDENKAIAARVAAAQCSDATVAVANRAVDEFFTKDFVIHNTFPGLAHDVEGTKQWNAAILEAVPDYNVTIDDQIAEGDKVVTRWTARGTHKGRFQGIAPTGRRVSITGTTISRYVNGKIAESWVELDTLDLMRQLGAYPSRDDHPPYGGRTGLFTFNITING